MNKQKKIWVLEWVFASLLGIALCMSVLNHKVLNYWIPIEIMGYIFFFVLGLYLGFMICKKVFKVHINLKEKEKKEQQHLLNKKILENKDEIKN